MHSLLCLIIYKSLDQTWELYIDHGVLLAACVVVFLTLSKKRWTCQSKKTKKKNIVSVKILFGFYDIFVNSEFLFEGEAKNTMLSVVLYIDNSHSCLVLEISARMNWTFELTDHLIFESVFQKSYLPSQMARRYFIVRNGV